MQHIEIELEQPFTDDELAQIELYRRRFSELWANWESLKAQGISLGGKFENPEQGKIAGRGCGIERHRLKGFYLDYRFFNAKDEPTNYFKISKLIGKKSRDSRVKELLKYNNTNWKNPATFAGWHGFSPDRLIDTLFNAHIFHSGDIDQKMRFDEFSEAVESDVFHYELTFCIYQRMLVIRNLNWVLLPLNSANRTRIRLPSQ